MSKQKRTYDTNLRYDFNTLYQYILKDRHEVSISDKEVGRLCGGISERQVRNAKAEGMDFHAVDRFCTGYKCEAKYVFSDYITIESLFAYELSEGYITWAEVIEQARGTFWLDQPIMKDLAQRNLIHLLTTSLSRW